MNFQNGPKHEITSLIKSWPITHLILIKFNVKQASQFAPANAKLPLEVSTSFWV